MMRMVVATITGIFMSLYFMYFIIPLISAEHTNFANPLLINSTDPTVITSFNLGQGFYQIMPLVPILVGAFIIISVALRRDPGE